MSGFIINRGSTLRRTLPWPDGVGGSTLAGATVDIVDASIAVTATVADAAARTINLHISDETTAALMIGALYSFRVRVTWPNGDAVTTNLIGVEIQ